MTAPSTITVSGSWVRADGTAPDGLVVFTPIDTRFVNNGNIIDRVPVVAPLVLGQLSQTLVQTVDGYTVTEIIGGQILGTFTIPGIGPVNLGAIPLPNVVGITNTVRVRQQAVVLLNSVGVDEVAPPDNVVIDDQGDPIVTDSSDDLFVF